MNWEVFPLTKKKKKLKASNYEVSQNAGSCPRVELSTVFSSINLPSWQLQERRKGNSMLWQHHGFSHSCRK